MSVSWAELDRSPISGPKSIRRRNAGARAPASGSTSRTVPAIARPVSSIARRLYGLTASAARSCARQVRFDPLPDDERDRVLEDDPLTVVDADLGRFDPSDDDVRVRRVEDERRLPGE